MKVFSIILLFSLIFLSGVADAKTIYVSSTGGNSDQKVINDALQEAANNPGSTVFLKSDNGPFIITGQIKIGSNTKLTGDSDTVVKVSEKTTQFFVDGVGVFGQLGKEAAKNIEIYGFSIDGNCDELNPNFADSGSGDHNAERLIELRGYTNDLGSNIYIHDMRLYDAFSDAIHIYYSTNVYCYNNFISNCQHSSIFYVCCFYSALYNNDIAGITSDCARLDNCQNCKVYKNIFYSYTGDHNNGAYETGQNGLQVGDQGHSHGGGSDKAYHTTNIEVYENTFANCGRTSIWIDAAGKTPSTNLYIHDNEYIGVPVVEREGIPVNGVNISESSGNVSYDNMPSVELSEKVFSSIFDILDMEFTDSGRTEQTADDIPLQVTENTSGIIAGGVKIVGVKDRIIIDNVSYIPDDQAVLVKTKVIQNPDLSQWSGIIKKINKDVSVEIKNGTAYATLKVKTSWYTQKKDSVTGKSKKSKLKTSTATFTDTYSPVPEVLYRNNSVKAIVNVFADTKNPIAKIKVPYTNATQKIEFTYGDNNTSRKFMIGERNTDNNDLQYTIFSRCDLWEGSIPHMGDELLIIGDFDPSKLHIIYYTPYESFEITDVEIVYHKNKGENPILATLKFIIEMLMAMYAGYKIITIAIE